MPEVKESNHNTQKALCQKLQSQATIQISALCQQLQSQTTLQKREQIRPAGCSSLSTCNIRSLMLVQIWTSYSVHTASPEGTVGQGGLAQWFRDVLEDINTDKESNNDAHKQLLEFRCIGYLITPFNCPGYLVTNVIKIITHLKVSGPCTWHEGVRGSGGTDPPFSFIFNYGRRSSDCLVFNGIKALNEIWKDAGKCEGGQHLITSTEFTCREWQKPQYTQSGPAGSEKIFEPGTFRIPNKCDKLSLFEMQKKRQKSSP